MKKALNIVLLSPAHPLRGGIASSTERLGTEFVQEGHQVLIASFRLQYPSFLFPGKTQFTDDPAPAGLDIRPMVNSINPLNWIQVGRQLARLRPDVIVVRFWLPFMGPALGSILRLARRNRHTQVVCVADNIIPHEHRPGDRPFTNYFVGAVDAFVVMSRSVEDDIRQFTSHKPVRFVPHPIYDNYGELVDPVAARRELGLREDERLLLFFGFIRKYKGLDLLLEALGDPRLADPRLKLLVAGEFYDDPAPYQEQIRRLGLEQRVILQHDYIPHERVKYYFGAADLVVQPYRTATQSGISQLAYHFERPMVVTRVGGLPEIVEHGQGGYVVEPEASAIAGAIADFWENNRIEAMTQSVRQRKGEFSWEKMARAILELAGQS